MGCNQTILKFGQVGPVAVGFLVKSEGVQFGCNQTILYLGQVGPVPGGFVV